MKADIMKILIVDDNTAFRKGLASYLNRSEKFEVLAEYSSGFELLENSTSCLPDAVLLDIEMPEMNGIETAKHFNQNCPEIKLIAITMYQDKVYLQQLIEVGFKGFVNKATIPDGLFDTIIKVLENNFVFPENININ